MVSEHRDPDEVIEMSHAERAVFGICPICMAEHGKPCNRYEGMHLGFTVSGELPDNGVHMTRLNAAPTRKFVYYDKIVEAPIPRVRKPFHAGRKVVVKE